MIDLEKLYNEKEMARADRISDIAADLITRAEEDVKKAIENGKLDKIYIFDYEVDENDIVEVKQKLHTYKTQLQIAGISSKKLRFSFTPRKYQTALNRSL